MEYLNKNNNNIRLDYQISDTTIHFLDVTIDKDLSGLKIKVYFKPTDCNSYLSIRSGHHPAWIRNIPKGQFLRVRRNCTKIEDYLEQVNHLKDKFVQKGYNDKKLDEIENWQRFLGTSVSRRKSTKSLTISTN